MPPSGHLNGSSLAKRRGGRQALAETTWPCAFIRNPHHAPPTTDHAPAITDHAQPTTDHAQPTTDHALATMLRRPHLPLPWTLHQWRHSFPLKEIYTFILSFRLHRYWAIGVTKCGGRQDVGRGGRSRAQCGVAGLCAVRLVSLCTPQVRYHGMRHSCIRR
jgi:hypothetical protein